MKANVEGVDLDFVIDVSLKVYEKAVAQNTEEQMKIDIIKAKSKVLARNIELWLEEHLEELIKGKINLPIKD